MGGRVVAVVVLCVWAVLLALTFTDVQLQWAERLSLQMLGSYPMPDGDGGIEIVRGLPMVPKVQVLVQYMAITLAAGFLIWFQFCHRHGR